MLELVDSMQGLGFHEKNPMMFEMVLKISAKRKGGCTNFVQFAEDMAELIVSKYAIRGARDLTPCGTALNEAERPVITWVQALGS